MEPEELSQAVAACSRAAARWSGESADEGDEGWTSPERVIGMARRAGGRGRKLRSAAPGGRRHLIFQVPWVTSGSPWSLLSSSR